MAQVYEYNSEKNEFKVMYSFEMHDFLPPCSQLNKNLKQIDYLMLAVHFARGKSGAFYSYHVCYSSVTKSMANDGGKIKHLRKNH